MRRKVSAIVICALLILGLGGVTAAAETELDWEVVEPGETPAEIQAWVEGNIAERGVYLLPAGDVRYLLVAWGEKPTGGFVVEVEDAGWHLGENVRVNVNLEAPGPDDVVTQALTYPHKLLALEPGEETVMVNFIGADWLDGEIAEIEEDDPVIVLEARTLADGTAPNPLIIQGRAQVFEATFQLVIEDGHYQLSNDTLTASTGGPEWAQFEIAVPYMDFTSPNGMVIGSYESAEDGSIVEVAYVPLSFGNASRALADVRRHWAEASVRRGVLAGFIDGYPDGTFRPGGLVTRAEFLKMLVASQVDGAPEADETIVLPFDDVAGHWIEPYVRWAVAEGWMPEGEYGETFGPDVTILRQEMALMAALAADLSASTEDPTFSDADEIAPGLAGWVRAAVDEELLLGYPDGSFRPLAGLSRAEAVVVVWRTARLMGM